MSRQGGEGTRPARRRYRALNGVLLLDKPEGMSSNHALQRARHLLTAAKGGHTGTLDPMATGLLPLAFGEATKFSSMLLDADKVYEAEIHLGITTDSGDADGKILSEAPVAVDAAMLETVLARFRGEIEQIPPMVSALKRDGKALYEYAREGIELERAPRRVCIHELVLLSQDLPRLKLRVACSKGTYIRSLAMDIGDVLGCGAHLSALRRVATGGYEVAAAVPLATLEGLEEAARDALLLPVDCFLAALPILTLDARAAADLCLGRSLKWPGEDGEVRAYGPEGFLGVAELLEGCLKPRRLLATA